MNVSEIAKKINKAWKEDVLVDGSIIPECKRIGMGSLGVDFPLFGGVPLGQISVFSGLEHSGKSLGACQVMAQYQREFPNNTCVYVDAEGSFSAQKDFIVKMTGLIVNDPTKFLRYSCAGKSAEEIFQDIIELQQADNIGLIVLDSAPALVSQSDIDNEFIKDNGMRSSVAKSLGKFCKQMVMYLPKRENALIIINQVREAGKTFTGATIYTEPCGHALKYYPSVKVRFGTRCYTLGDKTDLSASKGEEADGFRLKMAITKNRLGPVNRGGGFITYRYNTGLDDITDLLEIALKFDFIHRPNAQTYELIDLETGEIYNVEGEELKFRGKQSLFDYLNSHPDFKTNYIKMLSDHISGINAKSLIDEDTMKEILKQEASVEGRIKEEEMEEDKEEPTDAAAE